MAEDEEDADGDISSIGGDGSFGGGRGGSGSRRAESHSIGSGHGDGSAQAGSQPDWLQGVMQTLADATRALATPKGDGKGRRNLTKIQVDDFFGGPSVTAHQYRMLKKSVLAMKRLHGLADPEMALVLYSQVQGKAKQQLEILEVDDLDQDDGRDMVWRILDWSHEKMEHERADDAHGRRPCGSTHGRWKSGSTTLGRSRWR